MTCTTAALLAALQFALPYASTEIDYNWLENITIISPSGDPCDNPPTKAAKIRCEIDSLEAKEKAFRERQARVEEIRELIAVCGADDE